jgi:hypothetical protein
MSTSGENGHAFFREGRHSLAAVRAMEVRQMGDAI